VEGFSDLPVLDHPAKRICNAHQLEYRFAANVCCVAGWLACRLNPYRASQTQKAHPPSNECAESTQIMLKANRRPSLLQRSEA
jgi:hypothetical protein